MERFFHFASVAGQLFPLLDDRRRQLGYVGRTAWAEAVMFAGGLWGTVRGLPWAEPVNFVRVVASSGILEEFETYRGGFIHRDYSGGRQGSCQPIILNDSDVKR